MPTTKNLFPSSDACASAARVSPSPACSSGTLGSQSLSAISGVSVEAALQVFFPAFPYRGLRNVSLPLRRLVKRGFAHNAPSHRPCILRRRHVRLSDDEGPLESS